MKENGQKDSHAADVMLIRVPSLTQSSFYLFGVCL